jgi:hypothetical protein
MSDFVLLLRFKSLILDGFRKITPIDRSSLARAESDQDHLEFSHPFFYRDHPELLVRIKRKPPLSKYNTAGNIPTQIEPEIAKVNTKELPSVFNELRQLKEKQKDMETRMNDLIKYVLITYSPNNSTLEKTRWFGAKWLISGCV